MPTTFQKSINMVLQPQLERNMEAYIVDMIVQSQKEKDHIGDLREAFETLRKYKLKLNPKRCVLAS